MEQFNFGGQYPGRFLPEAQNLGKTKEEEVNINSRKKLEQQRISGAQKTGFELGKQLRGFGTQIPQEDFTFQERVLRETVGGRGDKIWGTIGEPVTLNHDLNPRQRGDTETARMFGF